MSYIVDFDKLLTLKCSVDNNVAYWLDELSKVEEALKVIRESNKISGAGADALKTYFEVAHTNLRITLLNILQNHMNRNTLYFTDYVGNIDTSNHARIPEEELVREKDDLTKTKDLAVGTEDSLAYILGGIKDIFSVSYTDVTAVDKAHQSAIDVATNLDENIKALEKKHSTEGFSENATAIASATNLINLLLSKGRSYKENFSMEDLADPAWGELATTVGVLADSNQAMTDEISKADEIMEKHVAELQKEAEEREEREKKAKWIKTGIAIIGSVALIVVTAGGAAPLVCAGVGAAVGIANAATDKFAENYINTGSLTEGMNWSDFTQACVVGGVTGAISGYVSAASMGSVIKQPIKNAIQSAAGSVIENAAEGVINTVWDVGEAHIAGMPGEDVKAIVLEDLGKAAKEIVVEGGEAFVGGAISGKFNVETGDKSYLKKLGEETIENAAKAVTKNTLDTGADIIGAAVTSESREEFEAVVQKEIKEGLSNTAKDFVAAEVESAVTGAVDSYQDNHKDQNKYVQATQSFVGDTVGKTAGTVAGAVTGQGVDVATGERDSISMKEVWEEDLKGGAGIVENAANSAAKNYADAGFKDKKLQNDLKKRADKNGEVEVVVYGKTAVLKDDVDAAVEVAGKGAYKDKKAQEILGIYENNTVNPEKIKVEKVKVEDLIKSEHKIKGRDTNITKVDFKDAGKRLYKTKTKKA